MPANMESAGDCPKCGRGSVVCRFNYFDRGDLVIHSWEHRCPDCGWRDTQAFRSDAAASPAESEPVPVDPATCPLCGRRGRT